ncbi:MAG: DUF3575 domain-containing protein [Prevotellaceae bacterium]|nr:DUF3575 domain-containing protein [Prevotellaceae bacterium]
MSKIVCTWVIVCFCSTPIYAQRTDQQPASSFLPSWAVKTNVLSDVTGSLNLGTEFKLSRRLTMNVDMNYNPWSYGSNKKFKHLIFQPELRYWLCEPFYGHFFGFHLFYSHYNVGGLKMPLGWFPALQRYRYQGDLYGAGLAYGYHKVLSPRWSLEFSLGVGYAYTDYRKYDCAKCGLERGHEQKHYFAPTKVSVGLVYMIK